MEREALTHIEPGMPIRKFPDYYNQDLDTLVKKIENLERKISERDSEIETLKQQFNNALGKIRAEYLAMFEQLNNENVD